MQTLERTQLGFEPGTTVATVTTKPPRCHMSTHGAKRVLMAK